MGIRDTSYYGWNDLLSYRITPSSGTLVGTTSSLYDIATDTSGNIFVCGKNRVSGSLSPAVYNFFVLGSFNSGLDWKRLFISSSTNQNNGAFALTIDRNDSVFVGGYFGGTANRYVIRSSSDHGLTWGQQIFSNVTDNINLIGRLGSGVDSSNNIFLSSISGVFSSSDNGLTWGHQNILQASSSLDQGTDLCIDSSDTVYWVNSARNVNNRKTIFAKSTNSGSTWASMSIGASSTDDTDFQAIACDSLDNLYFYSSADGIFSSSDGGTTWGKESLIDVGATNKWRLSADIDNNIYIFGNCAGASDKIVRKSGFSGSDYTLVDGVDDREYYSGFIDNQNNIIYTVGKITEKGLVRRGKLTSNSSSIGPTMLATSFGFVTLSRSLEAITQKIAEQESFKLNNVSEFPHSAGLFQMPSMVLGTKSSGRVGKTDDAIIQKKFIGSFVRVMFPKQDSSDVKGFDLGRQPGKLSTDWEFGDVVDIEGKNFDHLALNCVAKKGVSGTLDTILVRIETRPIGDSGFFIDQTVEQTTSGSYAAEAIHRDSINRKDVNYGDLSLSEVGWKIEQDLTNIKSLRISCRHKNGQVDDQNKEFLVLGRFIVKDKTHNET